MVYSNDDPWMALTYLGQGQLWSTLAFVWEKVKTVYFSETIPACEMQVNGKEICPS